MSDSDKVITDRSEYPSAFRDYAIVAYTRGGKDRRDMEEGKPATPHESREQRKLAQNPVAPVPVEPTTTGDIMSRYITPAVGSVTQLTAPPVESKVLSAKAPPVAKPPALENPQSVLDRVLAEGPEGGSLVLSGQMGDFTLRPKEVKVTKDVMALLFDKPSDVFFTPAKKAHLYAIVVGESHTDLHQLFYSGIKFPEFGEGKGIVLIFHLTGTHLQDGTSSAVEAKKALDEELNKLDDTEFGYDDEDDEPTPLVQSDL